MEFILKNEGLESAVGLSLRKQFNFVELVATNEKESKVLMKLCGGKFRRIKCAQIEGVLTNEEGEILEYV